MHICCHDNKQEWSRQFFLGLSDVIVTTNTSLVLENRRAAMIFIKYMHDIVLKISFLDIHSQNWNTGGHLKLWQEIVKIQHRCERISNIPSCG